ncbi:ABC transporter permease [Kitasatospora mediocidica]|uniref:ABC transporter permease n=1 Tax=Kitasatospora mediocidica TaxID=58352 RepID=UPI000AC15DA1|nr:ABC transporter permease [Kitasatospora mediocidica]
MRLLQQTRLVFVRSSRPWLRSPMALLVGVAGPLVYLLLFGPLLKGTVVRGGGNPWQWFVPGMLMQLTLFGAAYAGFSLIPELRSGVMERLRVAPVSRAALLLGRVISDVFQLALQGVLLLATATALGFRASVPAMALALTLTAVLGAAISSASYTLALKIKEEYKFAPLLSMLLVPLMLLSGVLLPMDAAPSWLHTLSRLNPLTHVVDALRAIAVGHYGSHATLTGAVVAVVLAVLAVAWGMRTMSRELG